MIAPLLTEEGGHAMRPSSSATATAAISSRMIASPLGQHSSSACYFYDCSVLCIAVRISPAGSVRGLEASIMLRYELCTSVTDHIIIAIDRYNEGTGFVGERNLKIQDTPTEVLGAR